MLKLRVIPILTFNGFALVKTKQFDRPRMVGNPVQSARIYNSRGVDELVFVDILASTQQRKVNHKVVSDVLRECQMPVAVGGGVSDLEEINSLLKIGADKVLIKTKSLTDPAFILEAVRFFGSQCISIALDVTSVNGKYKVFNKLDLDVSMNDYVKRMSDIGVGEFVVNSVPNDGMMNGFDHVLINEVSRLTAQPVVAVGGAGQPDHFVKLCNDTNVEAVGAASIFHFTQFTPHDIKIALKAAGKEVRL